MKSHLLDGEARNRKPETRKKNIAVVWLLASLLFPLSPVDGASKAPTVGHISLIGNRAASDDELKRFLKTEGTRWYQRFLRAGKGSPFDPVMLQQDIIRIAEYYRSIGYDSVQVTSAYLDRREGIVDVTIHINEGISLIIDHIDLLGLETAPNIKEGNIRRLFLLKPDERFQKRLLDSDQASILAHLRNSGYAYADVKTSLDPDLENRRVIVIFTIMTGSLCHFGRPIVENARTATSTVLREIDFQPGERYSARKLGTTQMQIYRLGIFHFVSVDPILSQTAPKDTVDVLINVHSRQRRFLKVGVGWSTENRYRGSLLWEHRDFLGGARKISLTAEASSASKIDLRFKQPYLLDNKTDVMASWSAKSEKTPKYTSRAIGGSATINREFSRFLGGSIEYRYEFVESSGDSSSSDTVSVSGFENIPRLRVKLIRNTSDDLFDPTSGSSTTLTIEKTGVLFPSDVVFDKVTLESRWYKKTSRRTIVALRGGIGLLRPVGQRQVPKSDLFYGGGASSVRGWKRQALTPFGGKAALEGNIEFRFPLLSDLTGAAFFDYGNVWRESREIDLNNFNFLRDVQYAIGGGIRYRTAVGPIRLDFGYQLHEKKFFHQRYAFHFNLGQAF